MIPKDNAHALDKYIEGWKRGDAIHIHSVMDDGYKIDTSILSCMLFTHIIYYD